MKESDTAEDPDSCKGVGEMGEEKEEQEHARQG